MFDFDEIVIRRGTHSSKWDRAKDAEMLPMWVADMDFRTAPAITEALQHRAAMGHYGYTCVPDIFFDVTRQWFARRHNFQFEQSAMLFTTGVVPAISAIIQALCKPGDGVIVPSPAYNCFFSSTRNSQCQQITSQLIERDGRYTFDFDDLAEKAAQPHNTLLILCNPHNPVGRCWTPEELKRLGDICFANDVKVLSDEIHCELVMPGFKHTAFATVDEAFRDITITCIAPSKAFNLAGLQVANIVVENEALRKRIDKQLNINEVCEISPFAVAGLVAAYQHGADWLTECVSYIADNYQFMKSFIAERLPFLSVTPMEATYLAWIDFRQVPFSSEEIDEKLKTQHKLWLNAGPVYGFGGQGFMRINLATRRALVEEGLNRLEAAFASGGALRF